MDFSQEKYNQAKELLLKGKIKTLNDLFQVVQKKQLAEDLHLHPTHFSNVKSKTPERFELKELIMISKILDVDLFVVIDLFVRSIENPIHLSRKDPQI